VARNKADREDIVREATALVERVEVTVPTMAEPIVIGFRRDGSASFYFGTDPVWQFNSRGELRRGFVDGRLLKAVAGRLVTMERVRTATEVELRSRPLSDEDSQLVLASEAARLRPLTLAWQAGSIRIDRQVPTDSDVACRVQQLLEVHAESFVVAAAPHSR